MILWQEIAFGPIHSRRLGNSLGINLLPTKEKICTFNCIYCECGWTLDNHSESQNYYPLDMVLNAIENKLKECSFTETPVDSITFSGNGEPTLHPDFEAIINRLLTLRDLYYPQAVITCLTNSTQLSRPDVFEALLKIDNPMLKLDAGYEELYQTINKPTIPIHLDEIKQNLFRFGHRAIIQSMFLKGTVDGIEFDNSTEENVSAWLEDIKTIGPKRVLLYSLDRETPAKQLIKFSKEKLEEIADRVRALGIEAATY